MSISHRDYHLMVKYTAKPFEGYSSLHEVSLFGPLKLFRFLITINFNVTRSPPFNPQSLLTFDAHEGDQASERPPDFSFTNMIRWRLDLTNIQTFEDYVQKLNCKQHKNFRHTLYKFESYKAKISIIESDWSDYADAVYTLYANVASKHPPEIYDRNFFRQIAKMKAYKLIYATYDDKMIGAVVICEEAWVIHSICCGLDYEHTTPCYAYSWMDYAFIRYAIESKKFKYADLGFTADDAKRALNFMPISYRMDVYANHRLIRWLLHLGSRLFTATINSQSKVKFHFKLTKGSFKH